jgi:phage terminase large subunit-like protein
MTLVHPDAPPDPWSRVSDHASGLNGVDPALRTRVRLADGRATEGPATLHAAVGERMRIRTIGRPWRETARPEQLLLCDHPSAFIRLAMAGRGWGKGYSVTNSLAEWATKERGDWCAISPTLGDARKILTESESGLLVALGDDLADYNKSSLVLTLKNGSRIILASGERPDRIRGLNLRGGIIDELASFPAHIVRELWDQALMPALRKGALPKLAIATTPRRSSPILRELIDREQGGDGKVLVVRGSTYDNADNLSDAFLEEMRQRYEGTTTGRQELMGELLADVEGALVQSALVDATRVRAEHVPDLRRVLIGCDPATTSKAKSDHTGIIAVGLGGAPVGDYRGEQAVVSGDHLYLLADYSVRATPERWAASTLDAADAWDAEGVTAEYNQGGDMVETMIRMVANAEERRLPRIIPVWASRSKYIRAEPMAGVWQQNRVHMLGNIPALQDGWASWVPGDKESPDELDASVHAGVGLLPQLGAKAKTQIKIIA